MNTRTLSLILLPLTLSLTLVACGDQTDDTGATTATGADGGTAVTDGGTTDGGTTDGGTTATDGGMSDGGETDGGETDGGTTDGGTTDGGTTDGGTTDGGTTTAPEDLAIAGDYVDGWGTSHSISNTDWDQGYALFHISQYDNDVQVAIAQNDKANDWSASLWSRFDWSWDAKGQLWYCQTAYDAATEADALGTAAADASTPATGGCGGFAWTPMTPAR